MNPKNTPSFPVEATTTTTTTTTTTCIQYNTIQTQTLDSPLCRGVSKLFTFVYKVFSQNSNFSIPS